MQTVFDCSNISSHSECNCAHLFCKGFHRTTDSIPNIMSIDNNIRRCAISMQLNVEAGRVLTLLDRLTRSNHKLCFSVNKRARTSQAKEQHDVYKGSAAVYCNTASSVDFKHILIKRHINFLGRSLLKTFDRREIAVLNNDRPNHKHVWTLFESKLRGTAEAW